MADPIHDHCRVVGCKCGGAARADAQAVDPTDLTPAEQAAAEALAADSECSWHIGCDEECHTDRARAVVAALRPHLAAEDRARVLDDAVIVLERLAAKLRQDGHPVRAIGADYAAELLRGLAATNTESETSR